MQLDHRGEQLGGKWVTCVQSVLLHVSAPVRAFHIQRAEEVLISPRVRIAVGNLVLGVVFGAICIGYRIRYGEFFIPPLPF